jgi:hypothetical protein
MYALVILLGTIGCACFVGAFVQRRGARWAAGFAVSTVALLYTHNWALFFGVATGAAWLLLVLRSGDRERRGLLRLGAITFGAIAVAYAPWIPSLLFQAAHTGAPWAKAPTFAALQKSPGHLIGSSTIALLVVAAVTAVPGLRAQGRGRAVAVLAGISLGTILIAWLASQASPAWATRYLAIAVPPLVLATAAFLERAGKVGAVALLLAVAVSATDTGPTTKSNVRNVTRAIAPTLHPGDLVISTQPEQAPALAYYLDQVPGLRWATLFGPLTDLGVTDWRDGVKRLEASTPQKDLVPLLDALPAGSRVALVEPEIYDPARWSAPWTSLVRVRSLQWREWMVNDPRFRVVAIRPESFAPPAPNPVRATVFLKSGMR